MPKRTPNCTVGLSRPISTGSGKPAFATQHFAPGELVDMTKDEITELESRGALEPVGGGKGKAEAGPAKPSGAKLQSAIVDAIGGIDPKVTEAFNRDGKPAVAALEGILGFDINEADRDAAWAAFQEKNPDLFKAEPDPKAAA